MEHCSIFYDKKVPEYFFDRNPENFAAILNFYRTDKFHVTGRGCALVLQKGKWFDLMITKHKLICFELILFKSWMFLLYLEYWGIDQFLLEPCCALKYFPQLETSQNEKEEDLQIKKKMLELYEEEDFGSSNIGRLRSWVWSTLEYPWTSRVGWKLSLKKIFLTCFSWLNIWLSSLCLWWCCPPSPSSSPPWRSFRKTPMVKLSILMSSSVWS